MNSCRKYTYTFQNGKIRGCKIQDVNWKHEYHNKFPGNADDDDSDKHLEARDHRYSCLISLHPEVSPKYVSKYEDY